MSDNLIEVLDCTSDAKVTVNNNLPEAISIADGRIVSWGCGEFGQHGHRSTSTITADASCLGDFNEGVPSGPGTGEISSGVVHKGLKIFSCGASHTVIVTDADEIYTWGNGNSGQLGCGNKETHLTPQRVRLPSEGKVSPIKGVACGSRHTTLWLENGLAFSWGNNFYAQLGYDFRIENYKDNQVSPHMLHPIAHRRVKQIACGEKHTLFLYDTGAVAACGCNSFGQLGSGDRGEQVSPKSLESLEGVVYIACGANHSLAITGTGEVFAWGLGRACGHRRQDVLQPVRMMTHRSNVVRAEGGSMHTVVLTANGTVYTWGAGTEGQLGHGSKVLYLSDPKPLSHDALPRVAQIACGDSYTAAVTGDGALYMWGKSSHVIPSPGNAGPSSKHPTPERVLPAGQRVARVACGSWHAMASTGTPEWQPLEDESEEEEEEDDVSDSLDDMDAASEITDIQHDDMYTEDTGSLFQQPAFERQISKKTESLEHLRREGTKLTLEEFYAPTPLPSVFPSEVEGPYHDVNSDPEEQREDKTQVKLEDQAVPNPGGTVQTGAVSQREDSTVAEMERETVAETKESDTIPAHDTSTSFFVDLSGSPLGKRVFQMAKPERARTKQVKEDRVSKSSQQTYIVRSKTMPVANRKPLKMAPTSTTTAFDWSDPPQQSPDSSPSKDRFVIHKHVSVQMLRKGRGGSGDSTRGKKPIAQVGLSSSGEERLTRPKEKNVMPQPPKFNRAKTFYGRTNHRKKQEAEPQISQLSSTLPAAPPQPHLVPGSKVHPRGHVALGRLHGPADHSPVRTTKPSLNLSPTISEITGRPGLSGRPLFSSASSWRMRSKDDSVL